MPTQKVLKSVSSFVSNYFILVPYSCPSFTLYKPPLSTTQCLRQQNKRIQPKPVERDNEGHKVNPKEFEDEETSVTWG